MTAPVFAAPYPTAIQVANQQYLPTGPRRTLSPDEQRAVDKASSKLFAKISPGNSSPILDLLSSPAKGAALYGGMFGLLGVPQ